jgi:hypothetical protein
MARLAGLSATCKTLYMKKYIVVATAIFFMAAVHAQVSSNLDIANPAQTNGIGQVRFTNADALGVKTTEQVKDADVAGSPYFDSRWSKAVVILSSNQAVKANKLKLDLYRNEVHYIDSLGNELIAVSGIVKRIYLYDTRDTAKISAVFEQIAGIDGNGTAFVQVLNNGSAKLLKFTHITVYKKGYDEVAGKDNYAFLAKPGYALLKDGVVSNLKALDEKAVLAVIMPSANETSWLLQNKNKLKSEKDIIGFLNYYNSAR